MGNALNVLVAAFFFFLLPGCSAAVPGSNATQQADEAEAMSQCRRLLRELDVFGDNFLGYLSVTKRPVARSPTWSVRGQHPHVPTEQWTADISYHDGHWVLQAVYVDSMPSPKNLLYVSSYYWLRIKSDLLSRAKNGQAVDTEKPYWW